MELGIFIYNFTRHEWLALDEKSWTISMSDAACFEQDNGRETADAIMERECGDDICYLMQALH